ncbi:MAG TPA: GNAT family N-acetyltransferase, partial [Polyangia bacterium]
MDRSLLAPGDEAELERFLVAHADSSMFLRGNARAAGLVDRGQRFEGTYVAGREAGAIVAVAACFWNGNVMVAGRVDAVGELAREAVA